MCKEEIIKFLNQEIQESIEYLKSNNKKLTLLGNVLSNKARYYSVDILKELSNTIKPEINNNLMSSIYCYIHNINEYPKCKICGKDIKRFKSFFDGWYETCSKECANIDKYGVPYTSLVSDVQEKMKSSIIRNNGGIGWASEKIRKKCEITKRQKYGNNLEVLTEKAKQTNINKYGAEHFMQTKAGVEKYLQSRNYTSPEYKQKCKERFIKDNLHQKMTKARRDNMYDKLNELTKNDVDFLFSKDEYKSFCEEVDGIRKVIKYKFKCKHCNTIFMSSFRNFKRDTILHCPTCKTNFRSWEQHLLKNELSTKYPMYIFQEDRNGILSGRKEIDIYCPDKNLAIEYNGINWHSEYNGFTKNKHYNKWKECYDLGIDFIGIWSDEFKSCNERIKNMLDSFFTYVNTNVISVNDIKELENNIAKQATITNFDKCFLINNKSYVYVDENNRLIDFWFLENLDFYSIVQKLNIAECILENRLLSYYMQYVKKYIKFMTGLSPEIYKYRDGKTDKIWNYGYQHITLLS